MSDKAPRIEQYMTRTPHTISSGEALRGAHRLMREFSIRHLPVVDAGQLVGVVSMSDLHLIETLADVTLDNATVREAMSSPVYVVETTDSLDKVAAYMANHRVGAAMVKDGTKLVGVFTTTDALIALLHVWKSAP